MAKKLSKRLQAVASFVEPGSYLADIGADHASLPIYLVSTGRISYAMAVENKIGPFVRMKGNIEASGYSSSIHPSMSDGISHISDEVNCLTLCGMGGLLACEILEAHPEKLFGVQSIILDPHTDLKAVRERVSALGFHISDETMVYEDKIYYSIIKFVSGAPKRPYTQSELLFGPVNIRKRDAVFLEWMELQRKKVSDILNKGLSQASRERYLNLYRLIAQELKETK